MSTDFSPRLVLADVDGTLVTPEKLLTNASIDAVRRLRERDVLFAITSGRPPRGMSMLVEPLELETPIAAFNGGLLVDSDMSIIEERVLSHDVIKPIAELLNALGLDVWIYRGADWYVPDPDGSHVAQETATVQFEPLVMDSIDGLTKRVAKLVGVSDDADAMAQATAAVNEQFGGRVFAATSQPYYLDVTHPDANKGTVVRVLTKRYGLSRDQIVTVGDMPNDIVMFNDSGLSIAMGNAGVEVKGAANETTASNEEEGFAAAMERFVLHTTDT